MGGIKKLYLVCPPIRKIIQSLKLVDYLHVQEDNPWYKYYLIDSKFREKKTYDAKCMKIQEQSSPISITDLKELALVSLAFQFSLIW